MADVDQCVRLCELAMCEDIDSYGSQIALIPNSKRVLVFRNKSRHEIIDILRNCKKVVQLDIVNMYYDDGTNYQDITFTSDSDNNRDGADIIHILPDGTSIGIELKFGQKTDRAIGMNTFEKIFETTHFTEALGVGTRRDWIARYIDDPNAYKQASRLVSVLNQSVDQFNQYYDSLNRRLSPRAQEFMETAIINNTGDGSKDSSRLLKYIIEGDEFREIKRVPTGLGFWTVDTVKSLDDRVSRVNILVSNSTTNVRIKYTLNWKNNYTLPSGDKVSAKLGLGSPSWNVWIDVEPSGLL